MNKNMSMSKNMSKNMNMTNDNMLVMIIIMILSGILSTMNFWVDNINDIRLSLNDIYMILLMIGWMFLLTGIYYIDRWQFCIGLLLVIIFVICIRKQFLISERQYISGMIPHHSMAILMSKKLLENNNKLSVETRNLANNIINTQQQEINFMKKIYK